MNRKPPKQRLGLDPEDVIAGRVDLPARDLIDMIRTVNPTGRDLAAKEVAQRYTRKSRLQSLLIRRFADDLVVAPEPHEPGVVSLRHRSLDTSACHALVSELDEDARSWVQLQLDLEASGEARAPAPAPVVPAAPRRAERREARAAVEPGELRGVPDLLRAGQEAVDAYDYELARALLVQALDQPDADADVAVALLSLFVDHLAADQDALALEDRLPAPVRSRPEVRQLLALAAARSGDRGRALRLLKAPHGARVVEVFVALARAALEAGDLAAAAADVGEVRARDPAHHELPGLAQSLAARRAAERLPREAELARLLGEGRVDEAEACARGILARWPDSEAGRRGARAVEEIRRAATAKRLVTTAGEALERGELGQARASLDQARAAGAPIDQTAPLQRRLDDAEEAERARAEQAELSGVVALLGGAEREPGLVAYLALSPRQRARARELVPLPQLGWLTQMMATPTAGMRARAAVLAVAALERAGAIVAVEPQAALDLLAAQGKILHGVSRAAEITREASAGLDALRREAARRRLDGALAAFAGGDVARAEALLGEVIAGDLSASDRDVARELEGRVAQAREQRRLVAELEKRRGDGELISARELAGILADRAAGYEGGEENESEKARWTALYDELEAEVGRAFRLRVDTTEAPCTSLRELDVSVVHGVLRTLLPGGRELLLVDSFGVWVFVRVIDLPTRTIRARVLLRTPQPMELLQYELSSGRLMLIGKRGAMLILRLPAWTVQLYAERIGLGCSGELLDSAGIVPGTVFLWVVIHAGGRRWIVRIIDLTSGRMVRELRETADHVDLRDVPGLLTPVMALVTYGDDALHLYDPRGQLLARGKYDLAAIPEGLVAAPGGERLFVLTGSRTAQVDTRRRTPISWCTLVPGAAPSPERSLAFLGEVTLGAATDDAGGLIYLRCESADSGRQILGVRLTASEPPALEVVFHAHLPGRHMLLEAWGGGPVTAIASYEDSFEIAELGAAAPALRPGPSAGRVRMGSLIGYTVRCHRPSGARGAAIQALAAAMKSETRAVRTRRIAAAKHEDNADRLLGLAFALRLLDDQTHAGTILAWVSHRFPDHPEHRLEQARSAAREWKWPRVHELLADVDPSLLDDASAQHVHHLLGAALLFLGRHAEALPLLRRGVAGYPEGRCELEGLLALALPAEEEASAPEAASWSPDQALLRALVHAVTAADARLAQGDAAGALRALDCLAVAESHEVQSFARRAEATLLLGDAGEARRFETAFALASFCGVHAEKDHDARVELPLPCGIWGEERLDELAERASRWLEATLGEAWVMPAGGW
jgi:hypothetical protein